MIRISKKTSKSRNTIKKSIDKYFGKGGVGLNTLSPCDSCACFEGAGGYVAVNILDEEDSRVIDIQSMEWEYFAKRFMRII